MNSTNFGKLFSYPVDGYVYAQPLYVSNVSIPGQGTFNVVYVATEHNSVYALNADAVTGGTNGLFWKVNLGTSAPTPNADFGNRYGAYADIRPEVGITGTPVIDPASGTLYVDAFTAENGTYVHRLHALDLTNGAEKFGGPVVISASVAGTGAGSVSGTVSLVAKQHLQRGGLTLGNGIVYLPYSGFADTDPYHGWVLGYTANTLQRVRTFNTTPNGSETGIWMGGAGLVVDASNNLYALTGNGSFSANTGGNSYGETFLKLSSTSLSVLDYFTPYNQADLSASDADLGSGGLLLLPDQGGTYPHLIIGGGKEGRIYVVNRDNMSKFNSGGDQVVQSMLGAVTRIFDTPAYFNGMVYYIGSYDYLKAFSLINGVLSSNAIAVGSRSFDFPGASPSISANGATNGIVWAVQTGNPATLYAYNASNVAVQLYNSTQAGTRDQAANGIKFSVPTIANSKVYLGGQYALTVYGLFSQASSIPTPPTSLTAATISSSRIDLGWLDNSNNETSFRVERSADNVNFVDIGGTGANVTTYSDNTLDPNTLYYYRVRATNSAGNSAYTNVASAATSSSISVPGLVGYWKLDEGTGSVAGDSSGEGDNGTLVGEVTWVGGQPGFGNALSFHGIGQAIAHVEVPDAPHLRFATTQSFTLSAWINSGSSGTAWASVIAKSRDVGTHWGLAIDATNRWVFFGTAGVVQGPLVTTGWHLVTGVQDGGAGTRVLYLDGAAVGTGPAQDATGTGDLWFANAKSVSEPFNGIIDDVRIYNRPLTASEIQTLANTTWSDADVGSVGIAGSATYGSDGSFTISGSGADIWGTADAFNYVYHQQTGDFQISARVVSVQNTDPWAKAGVMIRETLGPSSEFADALITPANGSTFQYRSATSASAVSVSGPNVTAPYWVKLARAGNTFTGSVSSDGVGWTTVGSAVIPMNATVYTGLPVTAHNNGALNTSTFDNVKVGATNATGPISVNFQLASAPTVSGYLVDGGSIYGSRGNGQTYGWSIDHTDVARDRDVNADQRLDTLIHFHSGAKWEIALPNGSYQVKVSIGDASFSSTHTINVEGVNYWNQVALAANAFLNATKVVAVTDGKLTVDQGTAIEKATRIDYIEITPVTTSARKINFQLANAPTVSGYLVDGGSVYGDRGNGQTYGWNIDHTDFARDRNVLSDQLLDTLIHFHSGGKWELAVPNGTYSVKVSIGDDAFPSTYTLNVEGVNYWSNVSLPSNSFLNATKTVTVSDGKLTLDQGTLGDKATRINYIEVTPQ